MGRGRGGEELVLFGFGNEFPFETLALAISEAFIMQRVIGKRGF